MADVRTTLRLFDEFLWVLRREGVPVSPATAIDAMRVVRLFGVADPVALRMALEATLLAQHSDRIAFERAWMQVFARDAQGANLRALLLGAGATEREADEVIHLIERATEAYAYLLQTPGGGVSLAHQLSTGDLGALIQAHRDPAREGTAAHAAASHAGVSDAKRLARRWHGELAETFGTERAALLVQALERAADLSMLEIRRLLRAARAASEARAHEGGPLRSPMESLGLEDADEVARAVRTFAARLKGRWRVRHKHARMGKVDVGATMRASWRTGGAPMKLICKARQRAKPRIVLLCDVSESVRAHTRFTLEFVRSTLELFSDARAFVFVREVQEVTASLRAKDGNRAISEVLFAGLPATDNSNYGAALARFAEVHGDALRHDTTLVILGDGRSNHSAPQAEVLAKLRARVRALHWLCPESQERWGQGDSAIPVYLPHCTRIWEARTAEDLLMAARTLVG